MAWYNKNLIFLYYLPRLIRRNITSCFVVVYPSSSSLERRYDLKHFPDSYLKPNQAQATSFHFKPAVDTNCTQAKPPPRRIAMVGDKASYDMLGEQLHYTKQQSAGGIFFYGEASENNKLQSSAFFWMLVFTCKTELTWPFKFALILPQLS